MLIKTLPANFETNPVAISLVGASFGYTASTPGLSSIFTMPPLYPNAVWMALELMTYGLTVGILYALLKKRGVFGLYASLVGAMLCGRVVWGIAKAVLLGIAGKSFGISAFIAGAFLDSLLGIAVQLVVIPLIVRITEKKLRFL